MNRRDVMQGLTAALVAALSPELLVGTATAGGLSGRRVDLEDLPDLLADLDAQVQRLRARAIDPLVARFYQGLGLRPSFPHEVAESMLRISTFRDLPRHVQAEPELQRRIRAELPRLGQQVLAMAAALRDLPNQTRTRIRALLRANPGLPHALRDRRRAILASAGAAPERIQQTDRLMDRVFFRLQRQHPSLLIDELVDKVRHASADAGVDEADWDALITAELDDGSVEPSGELVLLGDAAESSPPGWTGDGAAPPAEVPNRSTLRRISSMLLKIGAVVAGAGALMFMVGLTVVETPAGVALTIVGFLILVAGLACLGGALVLYIIDMAREGKASAEAPVLPDETLEAIRTGDTAWLAPA